MAVYGGLRSARWLRSFRQAPMVTAFRNLESGQVLFSQTLHPQQYYINQQFKWPNWQNKKPTTRKDLWRPLAVAEVPTWEGAVKLYRNLVELRHRRDMHERKQAQNWRRKSADGNIWYWNQFRPTYTYEAVADLLSSLEAMGLDAETEPSRSQKAIIHWQEEQYKGDDSIWKDLQVEHRKLPKHNPREQFVALNMVRQEALSRANEIRAEMTRETKRLAAEARANGKPTHREIQLEQRKAIMERQKRVHEARLMAKQRLLEQRPELADLAKRGEAVRRASLAWREAAKAFDHFTPRGVRGAAKQPIKLRQRALRQAKRAFRDLKKRISRRGNKRRVPQPRIRLRV